MNDGNKIDELIHQFLLDKLSQEEIRELKIWLDTSRENKKYFARIQALWELSSVARDENDFDRQKNWEIISDKIRKAKSVQRYLIIFSRIAAVLILAVALSFVYENVTKKRWDDRVASSFVINEVPLGSKSKILLSDGSEVWLNAGSRIKYFSDFNLNDRRISLEGEAYFHVKTDKSKPFIVNVFGVEVKATGTEFNVKAYSDEDIIETTLVNGIVSVISGRKGKEQEVLLAPNEKIVIYKKADQSPQVRKIEELPDDDNFSTAVAITKMEVNSQVETPLYTSWKDDEWIIENEKLESLAIKLERRFDVTINFKDDKAKAYCFTGKLRDETLEQVLTYIDQSSPIQYELNKKTVTLWYNNIIR
jgi:transmembrane sensor